MVNTSYNPDEFDYSSTTGLYQDVDQTMRTLLHDASFASANSYTEIDTDGTMYDYYYLSGNNASDLQGKLMQITDPQGNVTTLDYDSATGALLRHAD